jgi:hypothetical protein
MAPLKAKSLRAGTCSSGTKARVAKLYHDGSLAQAMTGATKASKSGSDFMGPRLTITRSALNMRSLRRMLSADDGMPVILAWVRGGKFTRGFYEEITR